MARTRYESELKRCVSEIILCDLSDPGVGWVTVNDVQISSDHRLARVFISVLGDEEKSLTSLERASGFIRSSLAKKLPWRHIPKLVFELYREEMYRE